MQSPPENLETVDQTKPLLLSDFLVTISKNYNQYHLTKEQLKALQEWVNKQYELNGE